MVRNSAFAAFVLFALAACDPTEVPLGPTCATGETVCGDSCCGPEAQCNLETQTCEAKCEPDCSNRECGSDGCGGICGECTSGYECEERTGQCYRCTPKCDGKTCGSDGCGGSCGTCPTGESCRNGSCEVCQPQCDGKRCGPDGCGGECGTCDGGVCGPIGQCVECMSDENCVGSPTGGRCSPDRRCVACLSNQDCSSDGSVECDIAAGRCRVGCSEDADCTGTPGAPRCDRSKGECVGCVDSGHCGGATPSCDPASRLCVVCASDAECQSRGQGNRCVNKQECVECTSNADCPGQVCNLTTNRCGECASDGDCAGNASRKACDVATSQCVECASDAHCPGQRCSTATNSCVQCLGDSDCPGGRCESGQCIVSSSGGDTCSAPGTLDLTSGSVTVNGDLSAANHDITGSCGGSGRDVVYRFTLASPKDVTVTVSAVTGGMRPVAYLSTACDGTGQLACDGGSSASASFIRNGLAAGTYFLWVDSTAGFAQGQFTLTITAAEPPPVPGDTCANAIPITFNAQGNATITGTLNGAKADYIGPTCTNSTGPEVVYRFTTQYAGPFSASVISHGGSFRPTLGLWRSCPATTYTDEPRCQTATSSSSSAGLTYSSMPAGTWYLVVDSATAATGDFDLQVSIPTTPPPTGGEDCSEATPIDIVNGSGRVSGSTSSYRNDETSSICSPNNSPDRVYTFHNPVEQNILVQLENRSPDFKPAIYLQTGTCGGLEKGCKSTNTAGADVGALFSSVPAGDVFLWVDSYTGTPSGSGSPTPATIGSFDLNVHLGVPDSGSGGESCASAKQISLVGGYAFGEGDLIGATDDKSSTCSSGGVDLVYKFTLPAGYTQLSALVEFNNPLPFFAPAILLTRGASCQTAISVGCDSGQMLVQPWAQVVVNNPPADTYYLWVEGKGSSDVSAYRFEVLAK